MVILPFLALAGIMVLCRAPGRPLADSVLRGAVVWGVLLTALTEGASRLGVLTPTGLALGWGIALAVSAAAAANRVRRLPLRAPRYRPTRPEGVLIAGIALVLAGTALTALAAAPNNFDSMTYHLARVAHWAQNGSVAHYPTAIPRQLHHTPWAEFGLLHLQLLSGGDRFANLVQWGAMVGSLIAVGAVARALGGSRRQALLAAAIAASLPMGILQASSTQNDYVGAFWLVTSLYFALNLAQSDGSRRAEAALAALSGAALGLAILTKATSYLLVFPFLIWAVSIHARRRGVGALRPLAVASVAILIVNAGHFARNQELYGSPMGPPDDRPRYTNGTHSPAALTSNLIRNVGLHTATPFGRLDLAQVAAVERIHDLLGIESDDPRTTWKGTAFFVVGPSRHEDLAGNPLHLVLLWGILAAMIAIPAARAPRVGAYAVSLVAAFLLFCAYLKWQPWHSRLHLPLFVLAAPLMAVVLARVISDGRAAWVGGVLLLAATPWVLLNELRPLVGEKSVLARPRLEQYFVYEPKLHAPYQAAARRVADARCDRVGLAIGENGWEYPLRVLMEEAAGREVRVEHVAVTNRSRLAARPREGEPCALIRVDPLDEGHRFAPPPDYALVLVDGPVSVYLRRIVTPDRAAPAKGGVT